MSTASAAPLMRDLSGRRLGRYEVLIQLASGGMATVYVARAQGVAGFERLVAIKVLHPHLAHDEEFISMFLDEARLAARIRHPNVVPTLDISDTQGDGFFLVMEYIEGDHLGAVLREAARTSVTIPPAVAARLLIDALEGLGAAHTLPGADGNPLGIVHRDVSPHNVLVGADGAARITDFGVAKAEVRLSSTRDGQFKGKLSYMAPEQASSGQADQRSDLFSMGIVLWETLTGRRLFRAENNGELLNRLLNEEIAPPSTFAPDAAPFDAVCLRALARDPDERFQSAEDFVVALEAAAQEIGGPASQRVVGRLVRQLLGSKMAGQNERIRTAIDSLGRSQLQPGLLPLPEAGGTGSSQPSRAGRAPSSMTPSAVRPLPTDGSARDDLTMGAKPSTVQLETDVAGAAPKKRSSVVAIVTVVAVLLIAAAAIAMAALPLSGPGVGGEAAATTAPPASSSPAETTPAARPADTAVQPTADPTDTAAQPTDTIAAEPAATPTTDTSAPVAPTAEAPDEAPPDVAAEVPGADGVERDDGASATDAPSRSSRSSRSPRRHRGRRESPSRSSGEGTSSGGSLEDDDLLVNPYRR